jgi:hypothetical protein
MMRKFLFCLGLFLGSIVFSVPPAANAAILIAQSGVQPATSIVAIGQANSLVLNWSVVSVFVGFAGTMPYTVTSSSGQFVAAGAVVGTTSTVLSASAAAVSAIPSTVRVTESVTVPPDVAVRANRLGAPTITYVRQFNDGAGPVALQANILIGGSGTAQFAITREALAFDDGAAVRVVQAGDALGASAVISFTGSGSVRAVWELAGPSSTPGVPAFRELQPVTRGLLGREPESVKSPGLPTDSPGYYVLRLRITDPPPGFDPPLLSYYVGDARSRARGGFTFMTLMGPGDGAIFDRDTRFAWQPVNGAKAYKVEMFASPGTDPFRLPDLSESAGGSDPAVARAALSAPAAAGMIVAAAQTQVVLSSATRARLQPRSTYFWRVQAIGPDGSVIGEAQVRQLRVP